MSQQLVSDSLKSAPQLLFQATLHHASEVRETTVGKDGKPQVTVRMGDHLVPLMLTPKMHTQMRHEVPSGL